MVLPLKDKACERTNGNGHHIIISNPKQSWEAVKEMWNEREGPKAMA